MAHAFFKGAPLDNADGFELSLDDRRALGKRRQARVSVLNHEGRRLRDLIGLGVGNCAQIEEVSGIGAITAVPKLLRNDLGGGPYFDHSSTVFALVGETRRAGADFTLVLRQDGVP